jgi:hypothetical protein
MVLAAVLLLDVRRDRATEERKKLFTLEPKDATAWTVACSGDTLTAHKRLTGEWWLSGPVTALADQDRVSGFLNTLGLVRKTSSLGDVDTLRAEYGLEPPRVSVALLWEDDSQRVFWGDRAPVGTGTYCRIPPDPSVWLVSGASEDQLCLTVDGVREARLFTLSSYDVGEVLLELQKRRLHLRQRDGRWWVDGPTPLRASGSSVDNLIRALSEERTLGFPQVRADSLEQSDVRITLVNRDSTRTEQLTVAAGKGPVRLGMRGLDSTVVELREDWLDEIAVSPQELRDRRLADLTPYTVNAIDCRTADHTVDLVKDTLGTWRIAEPVRALADGRRIGDLLARLSEAEATLYIQDGAPLAALGLDPPQLALVLEQEAVPPCSLRAGAADNGKRYAISSFDELCVVPAGTFDGWDAPADSFRRWNLLTASSYEVEDITLTRDGETVLRLERSGQAWLEVEPHEGRWEGEPIGSWIEDGRGLRGMGLLSCDPGQPTTELTLGLWGDKRTTLQLGQACDTLWARLPGEDAMCVSESVRAWATRLLPAETSSP